MNLVTYHIRVIGRMVFALCLVTGLAACAATPTDPVSRQLYEEANDPLQPLNEATFEFNLFLYKAFLKPVAQAYESIVPGLMRDSIRNFLRNLKSPIIIANNILQGEPERAGHEMGRFMLNTVGGGFGLFDPASDAGIPNEEEDFGQTLAVWGSGEGPYLMVPFLGPSNGRDLAGILIDRVFDPLFWASANSESILVENNGVIRTGAGAIDGTSRTYRTLDSLEETSLDFYASSRSYYRQQRNILIHNGAEDDSAFPDLDYLDLDY